MAAIKRIQVVLVIMAVLLMEDNTITPPAEPKECDDYFDLTVSYWRNTSNEAIIPILPASICNATLGGQRWYNYSNFTGIFVMDKGIRIADSTEGQKTSCPNELGHLKDKSKSKDESKLVCFAEYVSGPYGEIFFQRLPKVTYCGSFYVYQLPKFECISIKNTGVPHTTISNTKTQPTNIGTTKGPTTTKSIADVFEKIKEQANELENKTGKDQQKAAQKIINQLSNKTDKDVKQSETEIKRQQVLNDTVSILQKIVNLNIPDSDLDILGPASNILDSRNTKSWTNMKDDKLIRNLVITLENYGFQYGEMQKNNSDVPEPIKNHTNVQLHVKYIKQGETIEDTSFKFQDASFNLSSSALQRKSGVIVVVLWYKTINSFLTNSFHDNQSYARLNSKIITASVRSAEPKNFTVRINWNIKELNDSATCVYWKPKSNESIMWKTDGCKRVKDKSDSDSLICECDHLTAFAVMDISRDMVSEADRRALEMISTIGCSLSLFGICLTILIHVLLWRRLQQNAKSKVPSHVLMHLCVAIGMTDILSILAGPAHNDELVDVYTGLGLGGRHLKVFYVIGWGIPVMVVTILVVLHDRKDFITKHACWCRGDGALFVTFVATIGLILLINLAIFIMALQSTLSSNTATTMITVGTLRKAKLGLKASAILLPLLGLTWVFGLLVFNRDTIVFKYLFTICNSLQGMMIFVFHVLINKKVHDAISKENKTRKARYIDNNAISSPVVQSRLSSEKQITSW
ncbi:adhesion G- coupled receptor D1-like [Paramuricea clavata]|uniref:Adhesion G- coupled receptor D1-like n=1 Tax=Paramuricea clavata TaxID=317549 RepID=A0A7D9HFN0_PARCT|nr:adhesion G- coupled receptor D1-like [Paramuricea clavata]